MNKYTASRGERSQNIADMREDRELSPATGILPIGAVAPDFTARSTRGRFTLSDHAGQWVILVSHPGDFTPVCTSEFIEIAGRHDEFLERGCTIAALSVDSLYAHLAWLRAIFERTEIGIEFPIIEDPTLAIAGAYGMGDETAEDAGTVRATFFIDPDRIVRATTCYPATVGRSIDEMIRILTALQKVDSTGLLTPQGWMNGDKLLRPAPLDITNLYAPDADSWFYTVEDDPE